MSEASRAARKANRAKADRLANSKSPDKVDASDFTPAKPMGNSKQTGMRPFKPRTYKLGGRVQGDREQPRADKAPRGNVANAIANTDEKEANADKFGAPHVGGMKKGGKAKKACDGGSMAKGGRAAKKSGGALSDGDKPAGGLIPRKNGGRAKGKTNINIIVNPPKPDAAQQMAATGPVRPPPPPAPPPMMPPPGGPPGGPGGPPMPPPGMPNAGPPMMPRKRGGRVGMNKIGGGGGALGRLEKAGLR